MLEQTTLAPPGELRVVAVLGTGVVAPDTPILRADDLGALRGDGIFETMHVRAGSPWLLDKHLARMAGSAAALQLVLPPEADLRELAHQAVAAWPAQLEGALRIICTRGAEAGSPVTVFATVGPVGAPIRRARRDGIAVLTATQGFPVDLRASAPWLLGGAKTLSYAVNMACLRWATASGADDVLWTSTDGYALEAPTSTLVWLAGGTLWTVPAGRTGILAGTTARWLLDHAGELGWGADERLVTPDEIVASDGAWLTSSVRGVAGIRTLDGAALRTSPEITTKIRNLLGFPD
ncbi:aminotransferase class IV [Luedemannella helvata]|uniref:aminotransferase class IV n=1 Tax=Luedemannella helvata TaxID=349315 RepID=UPI0031DA02E8